MIAWLVVATTPAPPEPITRQTGLPEYSARCLAVGRDAKPVKLRVVVRGQTAPGVKLPGLSPRTISIWTESRALRSLNNRVLQPVASLSNIGWTKRWETIDQSEASIGNRPVSIKLVSEDDFARGVGIEIQERGQMAVPLYAGMCTAQAFEKKPAL